MHLRSATLEDLPAILAIYNEAILHSTATYDYEPHTLQQRREWFEALRTGGYPVLVMAGAHQELLGWAALGPFHSKPGYGFTAENSVYVAAEHRGQGIGRALLAGLIEAGRTQGLHTIVALIDSRGAASLRLHTTLGFEQVAHLKQVGYKFGEWLDVIYMQRLLG